jgi:hypothetical protein
MFGDISVLQVLIAAAVVVVLGAVAVIVVLIASRASKRGKTATTQEGPSI